MGVTKSDLFTAEQNELATLAKVFAHPARVAILHYVLKANACINGDLVQELGIGQATISQHLRELKSIGLLQGTIEGVSLCYCINPGKWEENRQLFNLLFDQYVPVKEGECC